MEQAASDSRVDSLKVPLPIVKTTLGGMLMGLANLVPGVSGGTMILVMGLYEEFISALAQVTRLRFTKRHLTFLGLVVVAAAMAIVSLAGPLREMVTQHRSAMYSLFIGLTLGGVPLLVRMVGRFTAASWSGLAIGMGIMVAIAATNVPKPEREGRQTKTQAGSFVLHPDYSRDFAAGTLGMSAMVLPGISGAYMFLILGRYEAILAAIAQAKDYSLSLGQHRHSQPFLQIMIPVALGALLGLVLLSNILKWMLHHREKETLGLLLGILLGSVVGIWPFDVASQAGDYVFGTAMAMVGFGATYYLSRINA